MSIKSINDRLDQMVVPDGPQQNIPEPIMPEQPDPAVGAENDPATTDQPIILAGKTEALKGIISTIKEVQKTTPPAEVSPVKRAEEAKKVVDPTNVDKPIDQVDINRALGEQPISIEGTTLVVQPASPEALFKVSELIKVQPTTGRPPDVRVNIDRINSEDELKQSFLAVVETYSSYVDEQRRLGRTFDDIIEDARQIGDIKSLKALLKRQPGDDPFNDSKQLAANIAVLNFQALTLDAVKKAGETGSAKDILEAGRLMTIDGYASAALLGSKAEAGRALSINRIITAPERERVRELRKNIEAFELEKIGGDIDEAEAAAILENLGGREKMLGALQAYEQLPDSRSRQFYAKTMAKATLDSASEIFQSAIVSGFQTHAFNFLGTPIHYGMITAERFASALAGKDEALMQSTYASLRAFPRYWAQALSASAEAFMTEKTSDMATKFAQNRLATSAENFNVDPNSTLGKSIDYFGQAMRLAGFRVLTTVDEGYKALIRGMEMEFAATDAATKAAIRAIENGASEAEAAKISTEIYQATIKSDAVFEEASEMARVATFQDKLDGEFLGKMQEIMSHPIAKLSGFPFFKTVTQIGLRGMERTPMAVAMPRFWKAMGSADPRERNLAMAKLGVSSAIAGSLMTIDFWTNGEVVMTGHGPSEPKQRRAWLEKNEPYSFGIKRQDGSRTWISFKRYEPIGQPLATMADIRDTVSHIDDPEVAENLLIHLALSNLQYITESQPALQFFGEIANTVGPWYEGEEDKAERLLRLFQKQVVSTGLTISQSVATGGIAPVGITNTIEKVMENPIKSREAWNQYDYLEVPGYRMTLRPTYEAIAEARSRSSYFTGYGVGDTDDWYEPKYRTFDEWASPANVLPIQVKNKKYTAISDELIKLKGGFPPLSRSMNEPGIKLNDIEWDRYKELVNYPERSARADEYFGASKPGPLRDTLIKAIADKGTYDIGYDPDTGIPRPATNGDKLRSLNNIRSAYTSYAKDLMLLEFPRLKTLIDERNKFEELTGKRPQKLPLGAETLEKIQQRQYNPR